MMRQKIYSKALLAAVVAASGLLGDEGLPEPVVGPEVFEDPLKSHLS
jgi:hypothetical protein